MRSTLLLLFFIVTRAAGQDYWTIKDNIHADKQHKKYPSYIEIDTAIIKNPANVIVNYNYEVIHNEGNRFYLPTKPFVGVTEIGVNLTKEGQKELDGLQPPYISSEEFNRQHAQDFYQILVKHDSVHLGEMYEAYLVIDSTKIKDPDKLVVKFMNLTLIRTGNKYKILFMMITEGPNSYDITIVNNEKSPPESVKFSHSAFGLLPLKKVTYDYEILPEKMPQFNSKEYKSFDDYLIKSIEKEHIRIKGKLIVSYTVMADGSTRFEGVLRGDVSDTDKEKIKEIAVKYTGWIPGENKGKKVNTNITAIYNFN